MVAAPERLFPNTRQTDGVDAHHADGVLLSWSYSTRSWSSRTRRCGLYWDFPTCLETKSTPRLLLARTSIAKRCPWHG
jgi:hypothetical protein